LHALFYKGGRDAEQLYRVLSKGGAAEMGS
jgi:hypothetical protein